MRIFGFTPGIAHIIMCGRSDGGIENGEMAEWSKALPC
jgi:hypothetical protein